MKQRQRSQLFLNPGKEVILKIDRNIFTMMAVVAQTWKLDMKNVLNHLLFPTPWSLTTTNGSLCKTNKMALSTFLEKLSSPAECLPDNATYIIKAITIVQNRKCNQKTFSEVVELLFSSFFIETGQCQRVDINLVYIENSWKPQDYTMVVVYQRIKEQNGFYSFFVQREEEGALQIET